MVKGLVRRADKVILLQEGLEHGDVGFYTGMQDVDSEHWRYVTGYKFERSQYEFGTSRFTMICMTFWAPCWTDMPRWAGKADHDGRIESPFLVLTSSLGGFAEMLYELLGEYLATDAERKRIRLMTSRQRMQPRDDFDKYFLGRIQIRGVCSSLSYFTLLSVHYRYISLQIPYPTYIHSLIHLHTLGSPIDIFIVSATSL